MSDAPHVLVDREGPIVTVTLNRPEARNAMDLEAFARMADAWQTIDEDPQVRVAILTGAGGHFSSGSDLKGMAGGKSDPEEARGFRDDRRAPCKMLFVTTRLKNPPCASV